MDAKFQDWRRRQYTSRKLVHLPSSLHSVAVQNTSIDKTPYCIITNYLLFILSYIATSCKNSWNIIFRVQCDPLFVRIHCLYDELFLDHCIFFCSSFIWRRGPIRNKIKLTLEFVLLPPLLNLIKILSLLSDMNHANRHDCPNMSRRLRT